jgi:putative transposase
MRYHDSVFGKLIKPISRRSFEAIVARHGGNAYDKSFGSWDHLLVLIFSQLSGVDGLRGLEAVWNANAHHHYHVGGTILKRSTLSDANARRPAAVFAETFEQLSTLADRCLKREGRELLRIIDSTPIQLGRLVSWADWNGRTRGMKLHVTYDPTADHPRRIDITPATVNDVVVSEQVPLEAGITYVIDKGYCSYSWWTQIHDIGSVFVTRPKSNVRFQVTRQRKLGATQGEGFTVLGDAEVKLATQGRAKLAIPLRRVMIKRDTGESLTIITNDLTRSAVEIAAIYKARWQIELLFRWIKQHLKLKKFLTRSENGVRLQLIAAMIAYLLLRLAARESRLTMPAIRFAQLVRECLFVRKPIGTIDRPPDVHPSTARGSSAPGQREFAYA